MSILTVEDKLVHYEVTGRGEPLIFLHGWFGSWRYWWPAMQVLSSRCRSFAFDFWGFGDSEKAEDSYYFGSYVDQLAQVIEGLGVAEPVTLVGHALGAAVGLRFTDLFPGKVRRLALVSAPLDGSGINQQLTEMDAVEFVNRYLFKFLAYGELRFGLSRIDPKAFSGVINQLTGYDFISELQQIKRPTLVINGEHDQVVLQPPDSIIGGVDRDVNYKLISLESCDHFPMLEQSSRFNRLIVDFLSVDNVSEISPKIHWQRRIR